MRRTTATALLACLLALAGCSSEKSQEEIAKECRAALSESATKTDRPKECEGLPQEDYDALLMAWVLQREGLSPSS